MTDLFRLCAFFLVYGVLGWIIDTGYRTYAKGSFTTGDGFPLPRWLPISPIYGFGGLIIMWLRPVLVLLALPFQFLLLAFVLTFFEYLGAILSERIAGKRLWNYAKRPFNFQGRVCLSNALAWGALGVLVLRDVQPAVERLIAG